MAAEYTDRIVVNFIPLASEVASVFTPENVGKNIPVQLSQVISDPPTVEQMKGEATATSQRPFLGTYVYKGPTRVGIAINGIDAKVARATTSPAVTTAELGRGVVPVATDGTDGVVTSSGSRPNARTTLEVGTITGGNDAQGTTDEPAYYRVTYGPR